jgi:hypothetical protein
MRARARLGSVSRDGSDVNVTREQASIVAGLGHESLGHESLGHETQASMR